MAIASRTGTTASAAGSRSRPPHATAAGFTLTELLVVVAIITIIAAFALPNYTKQMERTRRVDAQDALLQIAAEQEKFYIDRNAYTTELADLGFLEGTSVNGYYNLEVTLPEDGSIGFTVTARPDSSGPQGRDKICTQFSYDHTGRRLATGDEGGDTTDQCWR